MYTWVESIDQDIGDLLIGEQLFEGPQSEQFVEHVSNEALSLVEAEGRALTFMLQDRVDDVPQLRLGILPDSCGSAVQGSSD